MGQGYNLMNTILHKAIFSFFETMLEYTPTLTNKKPINALVAYLPLSAPYHTAYIKTTKQALNRLSEQFLFIDDPDEEMVADLTREVINIIAGHAKIVAQEKGITFSIQTPTFLGEWKGRVKGKILSRLRVDYHGEPFEVTITGIIQ